MLILTASNLDANIDDSCFFLGEWCFRYPYKIEKSKQKILPYHWDDREKLYKDFCDLQVLNNEIITALAEQLNTLHNVNYSKKYWNLQLGYWVNLFTAIVFDRWTMLQVAAESEFSVGVVAITEDELLPPDSLSSFSFLIRDDDWNLKLFSRLCQYRSDLSVEYFNIQQSNDDQVFNAKISKRSIKSAVMVYLDKMSKFLGKRDDYFFIDTYLDRKNEFNLSYRLMGTGRYWKTPEIETCQVFDKVKRGRLAIELPTANQFSKIIKELLPEVLPISYVEGYNNLLKQVETCGWPANPKVVFTSNLHFDNEVFCHWAGHNRERNTRLVVGEHGGFGGIKFNGGAAYQEACADRFISAGWGGDRSNISAVGNFRTLNNNQEWDQRGRLLLVTGTMPRYSYDIRSMAIAGQMLGYFNDQFQFVDNLSDKIRQQLIVRLYIVDEGWGQKKRWLDHYESTIFDENEKLSDSISECRLCICTYCATVFVDLLNQNVPTVIYWNMNHWEITDEAKHIFNQLSAVGVFHSSPKLAADHVTKVWNDVDSWWNSTEVQAAREMFCDNYSATSRVLESLESSLKSEYEVSINTNVLPA